MIDYIIENIDKMEELKKYIYGVHLSWSLSGDYVSKMVKKHRESQEEREKTKKRSMNMLDR